MFTYLVAYVRGSHDWQVFRMKVADVGDLPVWHKPPNSVPAEIVGSFHHFSDAVKWAEINRRDCSNYFPGM